MELAENGDLFDSIVSSQEGQQKPMVYSANHARRHTVSVIEAMNVLRQNGYLHRDLKAENLLFNKNGQMVLGDIGNIKDLGKGSTYREVRGVYGLLFVMCLVGLLNFCPILEVW